MKIKTRILAISLIVIMAIITLAPITTFATEVDTASSTITDLTNTTWYIPSGWTCSQVFASVSTNVTFISDNGTQTTSGFCVGYFADDRFMPQNDCITVGYQMYFPSTSFTITFNNMGSETSSSQAPLVSWLLEYGELQGGEVEPEEPEQTPDNNTGTGDSGTTEETKTILKGNYYLKDSITFPETSISSDLSFYVSTFKLGSGETKTYYNKITFDTNLIAYSINDTSKVAYYGPSFADSGWVTQYNIVRVETDQTVSKEFYDIFMSNVETSNTIALKTYGSATLPDIDSVWTDKSTYSAMAIYQEKSTGTYILLLGNSYKVDYIYNEELFPDKDQCYFKIGDNYTRYKLDGSEWVFVESGSNSVVARTQLTDLIWTSHPIYTDETKTALFFHKASSLTNSLTVPLMTGVLKEIVTILPIGMVCLISYLALRKGLKILVQLLQTA